MNVHKLKFKIFSPRTKSQLQGVFLVNVKIMRNICPWILTKLISDSGFLIQALRVGIVTTLRDRGSITCRGREGKGFFSLLTASTAVLGSTRPLNNEYQGLFPRG